MSDFLLDRMGYTPAEKAGIGKTIGKIKTVATFLTDAVKAVQDSTLVQAINEAAPWWISGVGQAVAESVPVVKFAVDLFSEWTKEHDPNVVGFLACTLAYQRSVQDVFEIHCSRDVAKKTAKDVNAKIAVKDFVELIDFKSFSFQRALAHPFVKRASQQFDAFASAIGYSEDHIRILTGNIERAFVRNLKTLLSNGKLREKFKPFTDLMALGTEESAYDTILSHVEYNRWKFEEEPVFGKEPFALANVYIETECGALSWGDTKREADRNQSAKPQEFVDPFKEKFGGRHNLLDHVLNLVADPGIHEPIVIQGVAGSGKSSFTLKLAQELARLGLIPLRIRLKDLRLDIHVSEALPQALFPRDQQVPEFAANKVVDDKFLKNSISSESIDFRGAKICRYVLILDGWDEISISSSLGFRLRVTQMLEQIRSEYINRSDARVRVILTGRPSVDVEQSSVLRHSSPLLTVRPIKPEQLRNFVNDLRNAVESRPVQADSKASEWNVPSEETFKPIFDQYKNEFQQAESKYHGLARLDAVEGHKSMEVLGLPLLAHLAVRLISQWPGDCMELVSNPTTLYRSMIDLTCGKAGKSADEPSETEGMFRFSGDRLRELLHRTAAAMTAYGSESISYQELSLRLGKEQAELDQEASELVGEHELSALMIAFFFKGGHKHLGCEFLHKSFREYLFAEGIIQTLKSYRAKVENPLPERSLYWKDFAPSDSRFGMARKLGELLSPQWLSHEVVAHLENLLAWEIERATEPELWQYKIPKLAQPLSAASLGSWEQIRDCLADLWDWWAEGVPLRPQPEKKLGKIDFVPPYLHELVQFAMPFDPYDSREILPPRMATVDSHLGDGLFRLSCIVHFRIAEANGWILSALTPEAFVSPEKLWKDVSAVGLGPRRCQTLVNNGAGKFVLFQPGGKEPQFFRNYAARIDAAAWRPIGGFPNGIDMRGIDLRGAPIAIRWSDSNRSTDWSFANLSGVDATLSGFNRHRFISTMAEGANFSGVAFENANLKHALLRRCEFSLTMAWKVNFDYADLEGSRFDEVYLDECSFEGVIGAPAKFSRRQDSPLQGILAKWSKIRPA